MNKTLYVSDLDGTLLDSQERVSDFTARVIRELTGRGIHFTYATARSQNSAEKVTGGLLRHLPVIIYNGVFVREGDTGENLVSQTLPPQLVKRIRRVLEEYDLSPLVYTLLPEERVLWRRDRETPGVTHYLGKRQGDKRFLAVEGEEALYRGNIFYFTLIGDREALAPAWEQLRQEPELNVLFQEEIYRPGEYWLELLPKKATKASAAKLLRERLGCERMVAFGDGVNDLPLFEAAQERCAMENAVPQLKAAADWILPSNGEDGVARWLLADTAPALALGDRAGEFRVRLYRPEDLEELILLFYQTVQSVALKDYSREEVQAWAPSPEEVDRVAWGESLKAHYTVVAQRGETLVGFGDMDDQGYLDRLYVHGEFQGRGVATALTEALEGYARGRGVETLSVHASRTARPFFEGRGYQVVHSQKVLRRGVWLENFRMERKAARPG